MDDDILINGYPGDSFRMSYDGNKLMIDQGKGYNGRQLFAIDQKINFLYPLEDGDTINVVDPENNEEISISFIQGGLFGSNARLVKDSEEYSIPLRQINIPIIRCPIELYVYPNYNERIYPIDNIMSGSETIKEANIRSAILFGADCHKESIINGACILIQDKDLKINDNEPISYPVQIDNGNSISFLAIDGDQVTKIKRLLTFKNVNIRSDITEFVYQYPHKIHVNDLKEGDKLIISTGQINVNAEKFITFRGLSDSFADVTAVANINNSEIEISSSHGRTNYEYGRLVFLGNNSKIGLRITSNRIPYRLIFLLLSTGIIVLVLANRVLLRFEYIILFAFVAIISCTRMLFAYEASVLPPYVHEPLSLAVYMLTLAPVIILLIKNFIIMIEDAHCTSKRILIAECIIGISFAFFIGALPLLQLSQFLFIGAVLPLALLMLLVLIIAVNIERIRNIKSEIYAKINQMQGYSSLIFIGLLLLIVRLVLLLMGSKEMIYIGGRFPLSVIFMPAYILLLTAGILIYLKKFKQNTNDRKKDTLSFSGYVLLITSIYVIMGLLVNDLGMLIYIIPAGIYIFAIGISHFNEMRRSDKWSIILLIIPLILIFSVLVWPLQVLSGIEYVLDSDIGVEKIKNPGNIIKEQNFLRILQFLNPGYLREIGLYNSENIAQHIEIMNDYTSRGPLGEGYMNIPVVRAVRQTCLNDNVGAVYLLAQFGSLGGAAVVIVYLSILIMGLYSIHYEYPANIIINIIQDHYIRESIKVLSLLSALVVAVISIYMLAANCNLLPFTGRNMYFLGLDSLGDIYESFVFLSFIAAGPAVYGIMNEEA